MGVKMPFKSWIKAFGAEKLATALRVHPSCVHHWKTGRSFPRIRYWQKIEKLSKGRVVLSREVTRYVNQRKAG